MPGASRFRPSCPIDHFKWDHGKSCAGFLACAEMRDNAITVCPVCKVKFGYHTCVSAFEFANGVRYGASTQKPQ